MALETSGFQLSQFERAPQIPGNIGVVDTKSIYGAVVDALKANEALRTTQAVQAATDAELALARQKAQAETGLLEPESEARRARANLLAGESIAAMPGISSAAQAKRAADILAAARDEQSLVLVPDRVATERAELGARKTLGEVLSNRELVERQQSYKALGSAGAARQRNLDTLADPNAPWFARQAAAVALGIEPKAIAPGIGYQVLTAPDGSTRLVATNKTAVGAMDVATGQVIGVAPGTRPAMAPSQLSLLPQASRPAAITVTPTAPSGTVPATPPTAGVAPAPAPALALVPPAEVPTAAPAPTRMMSAEDWLVGPSGPKKLNDKEIAEAKGDAIKKLPKLEGGLQSLRQSVEQGEKWLNKAEKIIETWEDGVPAGIWRAFLSEIPGSDVNDVKNLLLPVESKIFVDTLTEMRNTSPTGGAVGNVSDVEGKRLMSSYGSLDLKQNPTQLLENINEVRKARRTALNNMEDIMAGYRAFITPAGGFPMSNQSSADALVEKWRSK